VAQAANQTQLSRRFSVQARDTQQRLDDAAAAVNAFDPAISFSALQAEHARIAAHPPVDSTAFAAQLERMNSQVEQDFASLKAQHDAVASSLEARQDSLRARLISICGLSIAVAIVIAALTVFLVIMPIRRTARVARRIGQNDLQQRVEWNHKDDLGAIATELNRMLLRLRELRESESGRLQMEHHLSDAVVQSIFEPVIVTDAKGRVLRLNQAARDLLGAGSSDQMILTSTPGGEKILNAVRRGRGRASADADWERTAQLSRANHPDPRQ
jgi:nitrogen fixation/metabolism regulation signal transduction histidine kinase